MHKVLVLEDHSDLRFMLCEALDSNGFKTSGAGTIKEFWTLYKQFEPHAVVLDMMLPDGAGLTVAKKLRAESNLGIIFLSGREDEIDRIVALEVGADDFIVKPCSPRELSARLTAVLRRCETPPD